eukprot:m51a1_g12458 hypothetical protein (78) ;mRNA; r:1921-2386
MLQQSVDSSRQVRDLTLRKKIMISIPSMSNVYMHFDNIIQAVWPPEFVTFFTENPMVLKVVCEHIQAIWQNQRSNEL